MPTSCARGWPYAFPLPPDTHHAALYVRLEREARDVGKIEIMIIV
jgi:hypothetical protein